MVGGTHYSNGSSGGTHFYTGSEDPQGRVNLISLT